MSKRLIHHLSTGHGCAVFLLLTLASSTRADDALDLARYDQAIKDSDRQHWAFQPVRRPAVPTVQGAGWTRNPIDNFVLARLEAESLEPAPPAERRALLRRLYLDLVGLPPTLAEQEAFLKDTAPGALERLVEDLLARPQYGERWSRHWLDLVRYAETNGYERDAIKPNVWRYRDYVIRSFNEDKPFPRFLLEQLAGDELPDANAETLLATGYYRLGPWDDEPADPGEDRFDQLDDMVNTTSQVFLGLTLACARCHNHKFEPLTTLDYYRMVAVFNTLRRPRTGRTELDLPAGTRSERAAEQRREERLGNLLAVAGDLRLPTGGASPAALGSAVLEQGGRAWRALTPDLPRGYFLQEPAATPPATHLLLRGKASRPGPRVEPGMPTVLVPAQPMFPAPGPSTSRRRLTLAQWLASPENPLTARVLVNRVWQYHFGEGLVRTPSDFGVMGDPPTHPELLDWLADWFVREGGSIKKLHRLLLTSNTYRMSKRLNRAYHEKDPEDRLLWRVPYRRLEVEALRDSILAVSGQLNARMYGPSMYPHVPKEALEGHSDPDKIWKESDEGEASRRTIYASIKRSMVVPLLEVFDLCDTSRSTARRNVTSVAPQALTLFNGDLVHRQARHLADRLVREVGADPEKQIERAYRLALCRPPTAREQQTMSTFLKREVEHLTAEPRGAAQPIAMRAARRQALVQMCRVLFNLNEFAYTD